MSTDFWSVLIGAVVGGLFALLGGVGGAWWLGKSERKAAAERDRLDLIGAIRITESELNENAIWLKGLAERPRSRTPAPLSNVGYRSVQLLLARKLPSNIRGDLAAAYAMIPMAQGHIQDGIDNGSLGAEDIKALKYIRDNMELARLEIGGYRETLDAKPPP